MESDERQRTVRRVVFGVLLIGLGAAFTLDNLGLWHAGRLNSYWPLFLIGFGLPALIAPRDGGETIWGVLLVSLGGFFLFRKFGLIPRRFIDVWPFQLVLVGLVLILQALLSRMRTGRDGAPSTEKGGIQ